MARFTCARSPLRLRGHAHAHAHSHTNPMAWFTCARSSLRLRGHAHANAHSHAHPDGQVHMRNISSRTAHLLGAKMGSPWLGDRHCLSGGRVSAGDGACRWSSAADAAAMMHGSQAAQAHYCSVEQAAASSFPTGVRRSSRAVPHRLAMLTDVEI